jgi:hypothetical protein
MALIDPHANAEQSKWKAQNQAFARSARIVARESGDKPGSIRASLQLRQCIPQDVPPLRGSRFKLATEFHAELASQAEMLDQFRWPDIAQTQ